MKQTNYKGKFPHMAEDVVRKAIKDAQNGKDISVYSSYVRRMQFFSKYYPHKLVMKIWLRSVNKYIN